MFRKKHISALLIAILAVCLCTASVFAISKLLGAKEAADALAVPEIAAAFASESAVTVNESVTDAGYTVTFLGLADGKDLQMADAPQDKSYAVVAIARADGAPMPEAGSTSFFVSPLITGLNPAQYNIVTMHGAFYERLIDGVLYRMIACDSVELFADRGLSLCVTETGFYEPSAFRFDEAANTYLPNDDYTGLNVLFRLPIDAAKADPAKAEAYLATMLDAQEPTEDEADAAGAAGTSIPTTADGTPDVQAILKTATCIEASRQTLTQDAQGCYVYNYDAGDNGGMNLTTTAADMKDKEVGTPFLALASTGSNGTKTRNWYLVCTPQADGSVEAAVYETVS